MNTDNIKNALVEHGYPDEQATQTALELNEMSSCLQPLLENWISSGIESEYESNGYTVTKIKNLFDMTYPASLLTMDWIIKDPSVAINAINKGIK